MFTRAAASTTRRRYHSRSRRINPFALAGKSLGYSAAGLAIAVNMLSFAESLQATVDNMRDLKPETGIIRVTAPAWGAVQGLFSGAVENSQLLGESPDYCVSTSLASYTFGLMQKNFGDNGRYAAKVVYGTIGLPGAVIGSSFVGFAGGLGLAIGGGPVRNNSICNPDYLKKVP